MGIGLLFRWVLSENYSSTAPTVISLSVTSGPAVGGTSITITGTNFVSGAMVQFGGASFISATFTDSSHLTVVAPAGSGTVSITVKNPDGQTGTLSNAWTYVMVTNVLRIRSISPAYG